MSAGRLDLERTGSVGELLINRLRTGVGRAKTMMRRWGYLDDAQSMDCEEEEEEETLFVNGMYNYIVWVQSSTIKE